MFLGNFIVSSINFLVKKYEKLSNLIKSLLLQKSSLKNFQIERKMVQLDLFVETNLLVCFNLCLTLDPNLMRYHLKISLKSFENLLTIHAEDMKLIVDAILRRSQQEFFLRSSEDLLSNSLWDLKKIFWRFIRRSSEDFIRRSSEDLLTILNFYQNFFEN